MKTCFKCGVEKPLSEYYRHKMMADGHYNKCKECAKADATAHREANLEKYRAYDIMRKTKPHRRELARKIAMRGRENFPEKTKARNALNNAVRDGKITRKPCEVCGEPRSHAHHDDYSRPLDVMWLCPVHHFERHKQLKSA